MLTDESRSFALQSRILQGQQRLGLSHGQAAVRYGILDIRCQAQQAQEIGNVGTAAADFLRDEFLRHLELLQEPFIGPCFLDGIEILPLDIFNQSDLTDLRIIVFPYQGRHLASPAKRAARRRRSPAMSSYP